MLVRSLLMPVIFAVSGLVSPLGRDAIAAGEQADAWSPATAPSPANEPAPAKPATPRGHQTIFHRAPDGLFYVTATVKGRSIRFVLDTGASHVVLTRRDACALGLEPDRRHDGRVLSSNGAARMNWTKIPQIAIGGSHVDAVSAMVIDGGPPTSLLGQNLLARLETLEIRGDVLTLG